MDPFSNQQPSHRSDIFGSGRVSQGPLSVREQYSQREGPFSSRNGQEEKVEEEKTSLPPPREGLELDYLIGYTSSYKGTLKAHPREADTFVKSVGSNLVLSYYGETKTQRFFSGIHDEDITAVDISHNGRFLASGQRGSTRVKGYPAFVAVWEVATGEPLLCLEGLTQRVNTLSFSPDDRFLMASSQDALLMVWDLTSGLPSPISGFRGGEMVFAHRYPTPLDICFWGSLETQNVLSPSSEGEVVSLSLARGRKQRKDYKVVTGIGSQVNFNHFHFDPSKVQWSMRHEEMQIPPGMTRSTTCGFASTRVPFVFIGTSGGELLVYRTDTCVYRDAIPICTGGVTSIVEILAEESDSHPTVRLLVGAGDGQVYRVEGYDRSWQRPMTCSLDGAISSLSLVSDGLEAILGTTEGSIYRMMVTEEAFELGEAQLLESAHTAPISCSTVLEGASYSDRSDLVLVTGSEDGNLKLWDLSDFTSPVAYKDRACVGGVVSLTSLPSLSLLLSGWADGSIRAFDSNSSFSHPIWSIPNAHNGSVTSLDGFVSEETQFFVSGGSDGSVRFWSLHRRDMLCQFTEHTGSVSSVIIDKEKPHLVHSCDKDGMIFTFDLKIQRRTVAHVTRGLHFTDMVQRVDSEQELITSSHQGLLLSWDCDYSDPVSQVRESMAVLRLCTARSAKNRAPMLFYATVDNTVHMQVLEEDQVELGFESSSGYEGHANTITSLLCVNDNLISTDTDGCVCLWKVDG